MRLYANGSTSAGSKCHLDTITIDTLFKDRLGKLCSTDGAGRKSFNAEPFLAIEKD